MVEMPVRQIGISAGTAFKAGFFGFFGAFAASLIVAVVLGCVFAVLGAGLIQFISESIE